MTRTKERAKTVKAWGIKKDDVIGHQLFRTREYAYDAMSRSLDWFEGKANYKIVRVQITEFKRGK